MTVYNKIDHLIAEAKCLVRSAVNYENESLMSDMVVELENCRKLISPEQGNAPYAGMKA